jgi:hypothetical protein
MKEPELEDDYIKAEAQGTAITVSKRDIGPEKKTVVMTTPSGKESELTLDTREGGWIVARHEAAFAQLRQLLAQVQCIKVVSHG